MLTQITDGAWGYRSRQKWEKASTAFFPISHGLTAFQGKSRGKVHSRKDREVPKEE